jgi:glycosyltransferase involved in cell wall biosynthesis
VLLFVGSGELEAELRAMTGGEIGRSVFFAPFQNQSEMPKVYACGDVLVLPSFGSGETWGLAVNEAMSLGKPVIVSSHVGCAEDLVIPGETGWVFPAGQVEALGQVLSAAASDPEALLAMGRRARKHIGGYSYERATEALIDALELSQR